MAMIDRAVFQQPFEVQGHPFRISAHSCLACYPDDGQDAATLIERAEAALRQAKESGEKYLHFELKMHSDVTERRFVPPHPSMRPAGWKDSAPRPASSSYCRYFSVTTCWACASNASAAFGSVWVSDR